MSEHDILSLIPVIDRYGFEGEEPERLLPALRALPRVMDENLTARQREIVLMRYYEGLSQAEISRRMGIAPSVVSRHLSAARRKMKRAVKPLFR